jgi:hypothetical protein
MQLKGTMREEGNDTTEDNDRDFLFCAFHIGKATQHADERVEDVEKSSSQEKAASFHGTLTR